MYVICKKTQCQWMILVFLCLNGICAVSSNVAYFPSDVKICSAKDPNLNTCFTNSANRMLKHLSKGLRNLNAVPMESFLVPHISIRRGNTILPTMALNYTNTIHEGWKDAVVLLSKINPKDREFNIVFRIPQYTFRGLYEISGNITDIPMEGTGDFEIAFTNMTNDILMRGHLEERHTQEFLVIDDFSQKTHIDKLKINFNNLFNNAELSDRTNGLINNNDRAVLDEGAKAVDEIFGKIHAGLIQRILDRVPYKALFTNLD